MKLAISTQGPEPDSTLEPRFGRARYFRIVDTETGQQTVVDNGHAA
ncbi:MAG TPA: NifB/NifX family molybdenum-iron cluster-binding protein, partial [Candidatus Paceibacterota bacterium]|nr:NifB/NifX family molybdenum-iron cluster-binding protein [Candidatus Paceibacterota bacterium]